jgi:hypothetical protein
MSQEISQETLTRLAEEARKEGVSTDALLQRLMDEHEASVRAATMAARELPVWHLGGAGPFHRRDIYDDVR